MQAYVTGSVSTREMRLLHHTNVLSTLFWRIGSRSLISNCRPLQALHSLECAIGRPTAHIRPSQCWSARCHASASHHSTTDARKRVVFLGTPEIAALVLRQLIAASHHPTSTFDIVAVVSQPGRPKGRGAKRVPQPTPVQLAAQEAGLPPEAILSPDRAGDGDFLHTLRTLSPDLCITAAYGNYLPTPFLATPRHGTLNIHPSLLPLYRGAAPVQRTLQDGQPMTGVSVLYTVKAMDAGPILAQEAIPTPPDIQAPELLEVLFSLGTRLLVEQLESVWEGTAPGRAVPQDEAGATHAPKLTREEGLLDFSRPASVSHNMVRGFAGWPGTWAVFELVNGEGKREEVELKVLRTEVVAPEEWSGEAVNEVKVAATGLFVRCGDGSVLKVVEVQPPGKRPMAVRDFVNGLKGKTLAWPAAVPLQL